MGYVFIDGSKVVYHFGPDIEPVSRAKPGDIIHFETLDCFSNQIISESQLVTDIDFSKVNPATGPVYIEGVERGDVLAVKILDIETRDWGVIVTAPGYGVLGDKVKEARTRICRIRDGFVYFTGKGTAYFVGMKLPYRPMIGVIGVAYDEKVPCGVPGRHGGNMDTKLITKGATVYLPVFKEGGLLGIGDLHAVMGDGEVCVAGCEVSGKVLVTTNVIKGKSIPWPIVETDDAFYLIVSYEDINRALYEATDLAVKVLQHSLAVDWDEAYMLASMVVDIQISQLVDPAKTVRARIPKEYTTLEKILEALSK
ncbi:MAG: acetamidase/formamidase family protein [Candidatus Njordarchaeales archaeon]